MNYAEQLAKAIEIATVCHAGQFDKNNKPYILHPLRVMFKMEYMYEMAAAVLHDVVEDCPIKLVNTYGKEHMQRNDCDDAGKAVLTLLSIGFDKDIVHPVNMLSKNRIQPYSYEKYMIRVKSDQCAIKIKIADLEDNMDFRRLPSQEVRDWNRVKKYYKFWVELKALKEY